MIELLVAGILLGGIVRGVSNSGDKAVKRAVRSANRAVKNVADKADLVLQPCAAGRAKHKPWVDRETIHEPGVSNTYCRVCGVRL